MGDLSWALKNGDLDKVKELLSGNVRKKWSLKLKTAKVKTEILFLFQDELVNTQIDGRSPMHLAADYGQLEVLQFLAAKGADVNAKDKHGISVILAAIWEGHTDCVKFLLEKVWRRRLDQGKMKHVGRIFSGLSKERIDSGRPDLLRGCWKRRHQEPSKIRVVQHLTVFDHLTKMITRFTKAPHLTETDQNQNTKFYWAIIQK